MKKPTVFILITALALLGGCAARIGTPRIDQSLPVEAAAPCLAWDAVRNAMHYEVQISTNRHFPESRTYEERARKNRLDLSRELQYDRFYFWRVRAVHWEGTKSEWSKAGYFRLKLAVPEPLAPEGKIGEPKPPFIWRKVPGAALYEVQISCEDDRFAMPEPKYKTAARDYFPRAPDFVCERAKEYYWRVRSISAAGVVSNWSRTVEFILAAVVPAESVWPAGAMTVSTLTPTFKWAEVPAAIKYQMEILHAGDIGTPEAKPVLRKIIPSGQSQFTPGTPLAAGREYAWRIRPITDEGPGEWSKYYRFITAAP